MAIGKKTGGRDIKEGQVLNPLGRPKVPEDIKDARKMNKLEFERLLNKYLSMTAKEINEVLLHPETPSLDIIVCQVIIKAAARGDYLRLNFLLDRLIGKPKEIIQHEAINLDDVPVIILPSNNREKQ